MSPVTGCATEAGRALAHSMITGSGTRKPIMDWVVAIEAEARVMTIAEIRDRLVAAGWHEDSDDPHKWPVEFGWGALESDLDRILTEMVKERA